MNGKGKEYNYKGNLEFEGEYYNGKKDGKGKQYNYDGQLIFEGEYLKGNIWNGKGMDYYYDNQILVLQYFNGEIINKMIYKK